ncbi:MAG: alkaline phosphatase family protein [Gemmatimonadaceae bacterium]
MSRISALVGRHCFAGSLFLSGLPSLAVAQRADVPASGHPTLVVLIVVDQMRADYLDRFAADFRHGLGRLTRGGAVFTAIHDQAITETAPGHASILSGRYPRSTGIVNNSLGVPDPRASMLGGGGDGASPFRFRGTTLFDWLRVRDPRSRALSLSRKDRGAILPIGRAPEEVFWYALNGQFTTSTWYADTLPQWVRAFNERRIPIRLIGATWDLLLPASRYPEPDSVSVEFDGRHVAFPHTLPRDTALALRELRYVPFMDSITVQLALAGVHAMRLGTGPQTDLLSVSLSTTDAIGHRYGPDSRELHDQLARVDRYVGTLIDSLYRLRDSASVVFALTSDHGISSYPELVDHPDSLPLRVSLNDLIADLGRALPRSGDTSSVKAARGLVTFAAAAIAGAGLDVDSVVRSAAARIRLIPGVLRADVIRELASADTTQDLLARKWLRALPPGTPPAIGVTLHRNVYVGRRVADSRATLEAQHGTPYHDDSAVPLVFYGPGFVSQKFTQQVEVVDLAPTLAARLRLAPLERVDGRVLREALKP